MKNFLIIGGGVAGLSAANALADEGALVTLLESGTYPSHKVCGEFLSPEALPLLENWGIHIDDSIKRLKLVMTTKTWDYTFPKPAGSFSRYFLDDALAKRAKMKGVQIITDAFVTHIELPKTAVDHFTIKLKSGAHYEADTLLVSTGRLTACSAPQFCYVGAKAHFSGIDLQDELQMHLFEGAYLGIAPIGDGKVNVAGLIKCRNQEALDPNKTFSAFLNQPRLKELFSKAHCLFNGFMTSPVPEFGVKETPNWPRTFFLGDAMGVIPPATGDGLAMGLTSGILAAKYALCRDVIGYKKAWKQEYGLRIARGMLLHKLFMKKRLADLIPIVAHFIPSLPDYCYRITRGC